MDKKLTNYHHQLIVPRCRLNIYGCRAFPVAGLTVWNSLPDELRDPECDVDSFKQFLKQSCSALTSVTSALQVINVMRSVNPRFTYLLTYFTSSITRDIKLCF